MKDWDFDKFFPNKYRNNNNLTQESSSSSSSSVIAANNVVTNHKNSDNNKQKDNDNIKKILSHRRVDSDSKMNHPFFRGFRRENSDFFPLSSRHSAIIIDRNNVRSSGLFNNRRGSDVGLLNKKANNGEPILMDYNIKRTDLSSNYGQIINNSSTTSTSTTNDTTTINNNSLMKPRREKTESDIVLRNSDARRGIKEQLEARRREVELQFAKEADNMRKRNSRPIEINSLVLLSSATNSIDCEEYLFIQVTI